jgi:hypothetical protein
VVEVLDTDAVFDAAERVAVIDGVFIADNVLVTETDAVTLGERLLETEADRVTVPDPERDGVADVVGLRVA